MLPRSSQYDTLESTMQTAPSIPIVHPCRALAARQAAQPCHGGLPRWQVRRVTDYIDANLGATLRTASLAATLGLSVSHFTRAFKHSVGVPPRLYVIRRRLAAACEAMVSSDAPLTTIAHAHGFCDQSHFTRTFHEVIGLSPHVWRCLNRPGMAADPYESEQKRTIELDMVETA
jgi:transcriptional regulator GlxA family with amidase domain